MRRIVVIGDSQAGAFRAGWPQIASRHPGVSVDVFAVPVPHFRALSLTPERVFGLFGPASDGPGRDIVLKINGRTSVDLADADLVVWAGYRTGFDLVGDLLADSDVDGLGDTGAPRLMSAAAFEATLGAIARAFLPAASWRGWTRPRLVLSARPLAAERSLADGSAARLAAHPERTLAALAAYDDRLAAELALHGIRLHRQPRATIGHRALTRDAFSRGSRGLKEGRRHNDADHIHMNGDYGAICLTELMAMLPETADRPRLAPQPA